MAGDPQGTGHKVTGEVADGVDICARLGNS
jgi:hypothetical protein